MHGHWLWEWRFGNCRITRTYKADYLGVAFADEGISLKRRYSITSMVLNPENTSFQQLRYLSIRTQIYCLKGLYAFLKYKEKKLNLSIHIKLVHGDASMVLRKIQ
jgi:alanine racemase